ncbi:Mor transcription activator family protein [Aeromonas veronii]|uniref:Mor transcription activator family protein n=1 Tax=Aeromonas veronii TaxID=654 RepID=UPI00311C8E93
MRIGQRGGWRRIWPRLRPASWRWYRPITWGGRAYYIPTGDHLKAALRDRAIWDEFNGRNIDQLARKHGLSVPQTYAVVAEQRQLTRLRYQPDLFR